MQRTLSILVLSLALALGPVSLQSSPLRSAAGEDVKSTKSAAHGTATQGKNEAKTETVAPDKPVTRSKIARASARRQSSGRGLTRVQMQNVDFHVDDNIVLRIRNLRGALLRRGKGPPYFDDKESFRFRIDSGVIGISTQSLADLLNNYVFAYPHAPLKEVKITTEGNQIKMKGSVHKVTDIPFEIVGDLRATPEGKIQLHPTSIKTAGIPVKGLMKLFGVELDELIKGTESRGVTIDDNDITMDPEIMIPPPEIRGKISAIRIEGDEVIQVFGQSSQPSHVAASRSSATRRRGANYMYYRGGTIRFGKLTMTNADLKLVDNDPRNSFDFSMDHYNDQLVAGYSKNTPQRGLVVFVPDYYRIRRPVSSASSAGTNEK